MIHAPIAPDLLVRETEQFGLSRTCETMTLCRLSMLRLLSIPSNIGSYRPLSLDPLGFFLQ